MQSGAKDLVHIVESDLRLRSDIAAIATRSGFHCKQYGGLAEVAANPPQTGALLIHDKTDLGSLSLVMRHLERLGSRAPVIGYALEVVSDRAVAAIKGGAADYLAMPVASGRLVRSLKRVLEDGPSFTSSKRRECLSSRRLKTLSPRERQILDHLAQGQSAKCIARALGITSNTVQIHLESLIAKLGAKRQVDAVGMRIEAVTKKTN